MRKEHFTIFNVFLRTNIPETNLLIISDYQFNNRAERATHDLENECWIESPGKSQRGVVANIDHNIALRFGKSFCAEL